MPVTVHSRVYQHGLVYAPLSLNESRLWILNLRAKLPQKLRDPFAAKLSSKGIRREIHCIAFTCHIGYCIRPQKRSCACPASFHLHFVLFVLTVLQPRASADSIHRPFQYILTLNSVAVPSGTSAALAGQLTQCVYQASIVACLS